MNEPFAIPWPVDICAICLEAVRRPATIDPCGHTFCLGCIRQWRGRHNECPTCRGHCHGLVNVRDLRRQTRALGANQADTFSSEHTTFVVTPQHSPLWLIQPEECLDQEGTHYSFIWLEANKIYFMTAVQPGTLFVLPQNLGNVILPGGR